MEWSPDRDALRGRVAVVAGATRGRAASRPREAGQRSRTGRSSSTERFVRTTGAGRSKRPPTSSRTSAVPVCCVADHPTRAGESARRRSDKIWSHRRARERHLGRRRSRWLGRVEHAHLGPRPRQGSPTPGSPSTPI
jgi:hypothetical protein